MRSTVERAIPPLGQGRVDGEAGRVGLVRVRVSTPKTPPDLGLTAEATLPALTREEGEERRVAAITAPASGTR